MFPPSISLDSYHHQTSFSIYFLISACYLLTCLQIPDFDIHEQHTCWSTVPCEVLNWIWVNCTTSVGSTTRKGEVWRDIILRVKFCNSSSQLSAWLTCYVDLLNSGAVAAICSVRCIPSRPIHTAVHILPYWMCDLHYIGGKVDYELCTNVQHGRLEKAAQWLLQLGVVMPDHRIMSSAADTIDLLMNLRDGVLLCQLLNHLHPRAVNLLEINYSQGRTQISQVR